MDPKNLQTYLQELKSVRKSIAAEQSKNKQIQKKAILEKVDALAQQWFDVVKPGLTGNISEDIINNYEPKFTHLLKLSSSTGNLKSGFLDDLSFVIKDFQDDIILKLRTSKALPSALGSTFDDLLSEIKDTDQNQYLKEAIDCAKNKFMRAAVVLGWCAAIDHIQKKIEHKGFVNFNTTSAKMATSTTGRFKRFNKVFKVATLDDLKEVFDNDVLWVIEGMSLIDLNQHTRLKSCFDMRNHCAHPGEAPITPYNVMSFFSDINEIILKNTKFALT